MATKVTFDPQTRLIQLTQVPASGKVSIDAKVDLYSACKSDWLVDNALNRLVFPFSAIGGQALGSGLLAGSFFFLRNDLGWRIRPYDADHELTVVGNIYPFSTSLPLFVSTQNPRTVIVQLERSSLTLQPESSFHQQDRFQLERLRPLMLPFFARL